MGQEAGQDKPPEDRGEGGGAVLEVQCLVTWDWHSVNIVTQVFPELLGHDFKMATFL